MAGKARQGAGRGRRMGRMNRSWFEQNLGQGGRMRRANRRISFADSLSVEDRVEMQAGREHELDRLEKLAAMIARERDIVRARIRSLEQTGVDSRLRVVVDGRACVGCGACQEVCPTSAISVETIARVDQVECTGCGLCVTECPRGALTIQQM
jgi:ferredoxin